MRSFSLGILARWLFIHFVSFLSVLSLIFIHELFNLSLVDQRILYDQHFIPVKRADLPQAGEDQIEGESSPLLSSDGLPHTGSCM